MVASRFHVTSEGGDEDRDKRESVMGSPLSPPQLSSSLDLSLRDQTASVALRLWNGWTEGTLCIMERVIGIGAKALGLSAPEYRAIPLAPALSGV